MTQTILQAAHGIHSLKGEDSFEKVFRHCRKVTGSDLNLYVQFRAKGSEERESTSLGIQVRKKNVASAVRRNRIKRLVRESVRTVARIHSDIFFSIDAVIVSWNTRMDSESSSPQLRDVHDQILSLLREAQAMRQRRPS